MKTRNLLGIVLFVFLWLLGFSGVSVAGPLKYGDTITLKSNHFNFYLGGEPGDGRMGLAAIPDVWERWMVVSVNGKKANGTSVRYLDKIMLKSVHFKQNLSGNPDNNITGLSSDNGEWQQWVIYKNGDESNSKEVQYGDLIFLRMNIGFANKYIGASRESVKLADKVDAWERWILQGGMTFNDTPKIKKNDNILRYGDVINLRSEYFGAVLGAELSRAFLTYFPASWEQWRILDPSNPSSTEPISYQNKVLLRSVNFSCQFTGNPDNNKTSLYNDNGEWQQFVIYKFGSESAKDNVKYNEKVFFRVNIKNKNKYLGASIQSVSLADKVDSWEKWSVQYVPSGNSSAWMASVDDETLISNMTIPGTHDSGTFVLYGEMTNTNAKKKVDNVWSAFERAYQELEGVVNWVRPDYKFVPTQSINFEKQLDLGVRFFDIRAKKSGDSLQLFHGPYYCKVSFQEAVNVFINYLNKNDTETILISIKPEDEDNNTNEFASIVNGVVSQNPNYWYTGNDVPKLWQVRKKIILMPRTGKIGAGISLNALGSNTPGKCSRRVCYSDLYDPVGINIEMNNYIDSTIAFNTKDPYVYKREAISRFMNLAQENINGGLYLSGQLFVTFTSANSPPVIDPRSYANSINPWLMPDVVRRENGPIGIVVMDYPSIELVRFLISSNFR